MRSTITAIVLTKDEEKNIVKCLTSLVWCDEIIVIDDYSIDRTVRLSKQYTRNVYIRRLNSNFAAQRNFGIKKANTEWILFIDADEVVTRSLAKEIRQVIKSSKYNGYFINRKDYWLGKKLVGGEWGRQNYLRLGRRNAGEWKRAVHEYWDIKNNTGLLMNPLNHYPHPSIFEFIKMTNVQKSIHSIENENEGKGVSMFHFMVFPIGKFLKNYILLSGYKDGIHGFVYAIIMSTHSFLAWSELWISKNQKKS